MERSEFIYRNRLIQLKDTDLAMMNEALKQAEDEEAQRIAAEKALAQPVPTGKDAKKPDPKAAAKAKESKKGVAVVEDPNSPKDITIDYPSDVLALPNYVVIDRTYTEMRENAVPTIAKAKVDPNADKKALRLKSLTEAYEIIRAKPVTCATQVKLNYV